MSLMKACAIIVCGSLGLTTGNVYLGGWQFVIHTLCVGYLFVTAMHESDMRLRADNELLKGGK